MRNRNKLVEEVVGAVMWSAGKLQIQSLKVSILANGNCQGQDTCLDGLSVCLSMDALIFVLALKTLVCEAVNLDTLRLFR